MKEKETKKETENYITSRENVQEEKSDI